ncbi:hypothetical protein BHE74_00025530, partial [Ensete ventricosum]
YQGFLQVYILELSVYGTIKHRQVSNIGFAFVFLFCKVISVNFFHQTFFHFYLVGILLASVCEQLPYMENLHMHSVTDMFVDCDYVICIRLSR